MWLWCATSSWMNGITSADGCIWTEPVLHQRPQTSALLLSLDRETRIDVQAGPETSLDGRQVGAIDERLQGRSELLGSQGRAGRAGGPLWPLTEDHWKRNDPDGVPGGLMGGGSFRHSVFLPSHSLMSQCKVPSWHRLEKTWWQDNKR